MESGKELHFRDVRTDQMAVVAVRILAECTASHIFLLRGHLGAGKTTLVKELVRHMGIEQEVGSPTFSLINEIGDSSEVCYHMDLYRLESGEDAFDIGLEEYLDSGRFCFIEWPEVAMDYIRPPYYVVEISAASPDSRTIDVRFIATADEIVHDVNAPR